MCAATPIWLEAKSFSEGRHEVTVVCVVGNDEMEASECLNDTKNNKKTDGSSTEMLSSFGPHFSVMWQDRELICWTCASD